jgi:acetyltransferase-like isoleucine patch superfamily enzyme
MNKYKKIKIFSDFFGHDRSTRLNKNIIASIFIKGANFISPGVKISNDSVVLARSVLTKSFESCSLIGGHPAKLIKKI